MMCSLLLKFVMEITFWFVSYGGSSRLGIIFKDCFIHDKLAYFAE